jgi:hypothetical protein
VDPDTGAGHLVVTAGEVSFERADHTPADVPAGAECDSRRGQGLGTPYRSDATSSFKTALAVWDFEHGGDAALAIVLREAHVADTLSLWHMLSTTSDVGVRVRIYERMIDLGPLPPEPVTRDKISQLDPAAMAAWREQLRPYWFH